MRCWIKILFLFYSFLQYIRKRLLSGITHFESVDCAGVAVSILRAKVRLYMTYSMEARDARGGPFPRRGQLPLLITGWCINRRAHVRDLPVPRKHLLRGMRSEGLDGPISAAHSALYSAPKVVVRQSAYVCKSDVSTKSADKREVFTPSPRCTSRL